MNTRLRWIIIVGVLLLAAGVGFIAYNAGFSNGLEQTGKVPEWHGHYHPWGFGFPFFIPLFFIGFWLLAFRGFRGHHRHCRYDEDRPRG